MNDLSAVPAAPAPLVRTFGWSMLAILAVFLVNNVLGVSFGLPGAPAALAGGGGLAWLQLAFYPAAIAAGALLVFRSSGRTLRQDARLIHDFNLYLVRACFWAVLLVGLADAALAFLRVENLLSGLVGQDNALQLGRGQFVGPWIHMPLVVAGFVIAIFSRTLGFTWLALLIVVAELTIVITRFVLSYEQALMGDLVRYWYAALFLFASAYTLFEDGHVRVDVLYSGFGPTLKGLVNAFGSIVLGASTCWVVIYIGLDGDHSIINSPVANFEVSQSGPAGMYVKYQMAAFLGIFAVTMLIQFVSYFLEAVADFRGEPGHQDHQPVTA